eukprot:1962243-Lingulodinium_polyedra.AAC.1
MYAWAHVHMCTRTHVHTCAQWPERCAGSAHARTLSCTARTPRTCLTAPPPSPAWHRRLHRRLRAARRLLRRPAAGAAASP